MACAPFSFFLAFKKQLLCSRVEGLCLQCTECCTQPALKEETIPAGRLKKEQTPFGTDYTKGMLLWPAHTHINKLL